MEKKTDRRTLYTKAVIKDSLLTLMETRPFSKITVSEICRQAEISRGTYYLHYYEQSEILDDLLTDALSDIGDPLPALQIGPTCSSSECGNSLCALIRHSKKYRVLFMDESLSAKIVSKLADLYKESYIQKLKDDFSVNISEMEAEAIFYFQINGCLSISKSGLELDCDSWKRIRASVDSFITGGIEKLHDNAGTRKILQR